MDYTLVNLTADESIPNQTQTAIPWDQAVVDTLSMWSSGSPTRITIPSGVSKVRFSACTRWQAQVPANGQRRIFLLKNGSAQPTGSLNHSEDAMQGGNSMSMPALSAILDVTNGDYFELIVEQNQGSSLNFRSGEPCWLQCEVIA